MGQPVVATGSVRQTPHERLDPARTFVHVASVTNGPDSGKRQGIPGESARGARGLASQASAHPVRVV